MGEGSQGAQRSCAVPSKIMGSLRGCRIIFCDEREEGPRGFSALHPALPSQAPSTARAVDCLICLGLFQIAGSKAN